MFVELDVVRKSCTKLYIEVPDSFDVNRLFHGVNQKEIGRISAETTDSSDWDDYGWEQDVETESVKVVSQQ